MNIKMTEAADIGEFKFRLFCTIRSEPNCCRMHFQNEHSFCLRFETMQMYLNKYSVIKMYGLRIICQIKKHDIHTNICLISQRARHRDTSVLYHLKSLNGNTNASVKNSAKTEREKKNSNNDKNQKIE